jgi:hypothetical protein
LPKASGTCADTVAVPLANAVASLDGTLAVQPVPPPEDAGAIHNFSAAAITTAFLSKSSIVAPRSGGSVALFEALGFIPNFLGVLEQIIRTAFRGSVRLFEALGFISNFLGVLEQMIRTTFRSSVALFVFIGRRSGV